MEVSSHSVPQTSKYLRDSVQTVGKYSELIYLVFERQFVGTSCCLDILGRFFFINYLTNISYKNLELAGGTKIKIKSAAQKSSRHRIYYKSGAFSTTTNRNYVHLPTDISPAHPLTAICKCITQNKMRTRILDRSGKKKTSCRSILNV